MSILKMCINCTFFCFSGMVGARKSESQTMDVLESENVLLECR